MNRKLEMFLLQIQATYGTAESDLAAADFIEVQPGAKLDFLPESDKNPTVSGSYNNNQSIPGAMGYSFELPFAMRSFGGGQTAVPDWMRSAQIAGFALSNSLAGGEYKHIITWDGSRHDATIWKYGGGIGTVQLKQAHNCVADWKIACERNKKAIFTLMGKGAAAAVPTSGTKPTITVNGSLTPAVKESTDLIMGGGVYEFLNFEITGNLPVEQRVSGDAGGYGQSEFTDAEIRWKATVYAEGPGVVDPYAAWRDSDTGEFSILWGPTGRMLYILGTSTDLEIVGESENGNLVTWDLEGKVLANGFSVTANSDLT